MVLVLQVLDQLLGVWNGLQLMQLLLLHALAGLMTVLYLVLMDLSLMKWELIRG